jgi:hypothetical protein
MQAVNENLSALRHGFVYIACQASRRSDSSAIYMLASTFLFNRRTKNQKTSDNNGAFTKDGRNISLALP